MEALDRLIARRHGVVRRADLHARGLSEDVIWRQTRQGIWRVAGPGILVHDSAAPGLATDSRIAGLWMPNAILTGPSAAVLWPQLAWKGQEFPQRAMLIGRRSGRGPWRAVRHPGARGVRVDGARVADHTTTVIDLLRFLPDERQAVAIGTSAINTGLTTVDRLQHRLPRLGSLEGVQQLRWVVGLLEFGVRSVPEHDLHEALRRAGIDGWTPNAELTVRGRTFRVDVAFEAERVYLEYDGREPHSGDAAFDRDRDRQNYLSAAGWLPIRVTKEMLANPHRLAALMQQIRAALAERRSAA